MDPECVIIPPWHPAALQKIAAQKRFIIDGISQKVCEYDDNGAIGKRYRRQDEIWTPFCITIDQQSCEDGETVTIRDRDTMEQKRIRISEIADYMK